MDAWIAIVSGLVAGAASTPHCIAMCGPLAAFAAGADERAAGARIARHQIGRAIAYAGLGAIAGGSGAAIATMLAPEWVSVLLGAVLAIAMIAMAIRLVRRPLAPRLVGILSRPRTPRHEAEDALGPSPPAAARGALPRSRAILRIASTRFVARVIGRLPREPLLIGALSALLPCGALYSALLIAASGGSASSGAASMASFAAASGSGLLAASWIAKKARSELGRRTLAALLVIGALIVLARPIGQALSSDAAPLCHPRD